MAQQQRRVTELANATGISRNTITSTSQNDGKMIQLETINKLCQALDVDPSAFFEYVPFDFNYYSEVGDFDEEYYNKEHLPLFELAGFINVTVNSTRVTSIEFSGYVENHGPIDYENGSTILDAGLHPKDQAEMDKLTPYLSKLSPSFITDIKKDFSQVVLASFVEGKLEKNIESIAPSIDVSFKLPNN